MIFQILYIFYQIYMHNSYFFKYLCFSYIFVTALTTLIIPPPKTQILSEEPRIFANTNCPRFKLNPHQQILIKNWTISKYFNDFQTKKKVTKQCSLLNNSSVSTYQIKLLFDQQQPNQGYQIISSIQTAILKVSSYSGYVYGLQSLFQLIDGEKIYEGVVKDQPLVSYRGIMIDSVRHFISIQYIERLILVMSQVHLNMLHWHLSDDEAFVLELQKHPQMAQEGAYDVESFYTLNQMKYLIQLAKQNAVNIIPQFDTPAHVRSWGLPQKWKKIDLTILCPKGQGYNHQLDLSKPQTFELVSEVWQEIAQIFKDSPFLHLGGDEVFGACWDRRPEIKDFMAEHNLKTYGELQNYWRDTLKSSLKNRKFVFWRNDASDLITYQQNILQYWGAQSDTSKFVSGTQSNIILSPSDILYLNKGQSFIWQNTTGGSYSTWRQIYENFQVFPQGVEKNRILGAQACLWGEVSNEDTFENNLWPRATAFALRVWRQQRMELSEMVQMLLSFSKLMKSYGVQPSPFIPQFCEINVQTCFGKDRSLLFEQQ